LPTNYPDPDPDSGGFGKFGKKVVQFGTLSYPTLVWRLKC